MLKSRINWLVQSGRNTFFYHVLAFTRRKRNHIALIKNEMGDWITDERGTMNHFREGFISLYTSSHMSSPRVFTRSSSWGSHLSDEVSCSFRTMVSLEKVKDALWSMKPYKALGPDELHAGFFQWFGSQ